MLWTAFINFSKFMNLAIDPSNLFQSDKTVHLFKSFNLRRENWPTTYSASCRCSLVTRLPRGAVFIAGPVFSTQNQELQTESRAAPSWRDLFSSKSKLEALSVWRRGAYAYMSLNSSWLLNGPSSHQIKTFKVTARANFLCRASFYISEERHMSKMILSFNLRQILRKEKPAAHENAR